MLSLTRKADYAILAMAELARRSTTRLSARELSDCTGVPLPMLTNVLHQLLHHGLVTSVLGSKGGYSLAKSAEEVSLAELIGAIEGKFKLAACCEEEENDADMTCDLADGCQIKGPVKRVHDSLHRFLGEVTLSHIAFDEVPLGGIKRSGVREERTRGMTVVE